MVDLEHIRTVLAAREPALQADARMRASVAVVLHAAADGPRVLLIRRARVPGDPWSGDVAFPGGRVDAADRSSRHTAERETREEVGLDLAAGDYLGRLDDLQGRAIPIVVSGFVYALAREPRLTLSHEVRAARWVSFSELLDPARHSTETFDYQGHALEVPAIDVEAGEGPPLWGLTYRFLELFLRELGHTLPVMPWREDL